MRFKLHTSSRQIIWDLRRALSLSYLHSLAYPAAMVPQGQCSNNLYFTYQWPQCARVGGKTLLSSLACPALPTAVLTLQLTKLKCGGWGPYQEDVTKETSVPPPTPFSPQPCLNTHTHWQNNYTVKIFHCLLEKSCLPFLMQFTWHT